MKINPSPLKSLITKTSLSVSGLAVFLGLAPVTPEPAATSDLTQPLFTLNTAAAQDGGGGGGCSGSSNDPAPLPPYEPVPWIVTSFVPLPPRDTIPNPPPGGNPGQPPSRGQ